MTEKMNSTRSEPKYTNLLLMQYSKISGISVNPAGPVWVTLLRREGWLAVDADGRKVGMIIAVTDAGTPFLKVAGFFSAKPCLLVKDRRGYPSRSKGFLRTCRKK